MITFGLCALLALQAAGAPPAADRAVVTEAEKQDAEAEFKLGRARAEGLGGYEVDPYRAADHYRRAANQGHALAQYALGWSYIFGEGVSKSDVEGVRWIRKAAEQGSGEAQVSLAEAYERGSHGLDEDQRLAFLWSHRAASQGFIAGADNIATVYEDGEVLPKDLVRAYAWRSLAGTLEVRAGGKPDEDELRELAKKMTRPQLAAAAKLVREWGGKVPPLATISPQPASSVPKADAATIALARTLAAELQKAHALTEASVPWPEGLNALGHLALTSRDPLLVQGAYDAMATRLSSMALEGKDPRDGHPVSVAAIMAGLRRTERPILAAAIRAASALNRGEQGHTPSLETMADLALKHREPDVRYAALDALYQVSVFVSTRAELVPEVMALAMDDSNEVVVAMNLWMFGSLVRASPAFTAQHPKITRSLVRLRKEGSPVLRASAIAATAKMYYSGTAEIAGPGTAPGPDAEAFGSELLRALDDPSPIVRGQAASAFALLPYVGGVVPKLVALLDDAASVNGAAVSGLRSLAADEPIEVGVRVVEMGEPETVAMAALRALMVRSVFQDAKQPKALKCDDPARTFAECAARARAWGRRVAGNQRVPKAPAPAPSAAWAPPADAVRVGGPIRMPEQRVKMGAAYPEEARRRGASGVVVVEAMIGPKGEVAAARILRGIQGLDEAALTAVRQWAFEPTSVDGKPVPVIVTLTVNFQL